MNININKQIQVREQDLIVWEKELLRLQEQIKLKEVAEELLETKIIETKKAISDLMKEVIK